MNAELLDEKERKRIIYVDDANFSLISVKNRLKEHYEVYTAQSADRLFLILEKIFPSLIILDINMPGQNGFDIIKKLKADERYFDIPVIFLTSNNDRESVIKCFRLGACDYLTKPFNDTQLMERIELQINPDTRRKSWTEETIRKTIICVDDINYSLISLKGRLKEHYDIFTANSVSRMYEILERVTPDLILLDINMPGMNGYEAIEKLKSDIRYSGIPVIFLTSEDGKASMLKCFSLGAADYVVKPFTNADLIRRIEYHVNPKKPILPDNSETQSDKACVLAVDESFGTLSTTQHVFNDDYSGPLSAMMQKKFAVYYALRDEYEVCLLSKPDEVKGFLEQKQPNLFLLDANTLVSDKFDLISLIRKFPEHKDTPIIILTSAETVKYSDSGACDIIIKPFTPEILREKVAKYI